MKAAKPKGPSRPQGGLVQWFPTEKTVNRVRLSPLAESRDLNECEDWQDYTVLI